MDLALTTLADQMYKELLERAKLIQGEWDTDNNFSGLIESTYSWYDCTCVPVLGIVRGSRPEIDRVMTSLETSFQDYLNRNDIQESRPY